MATLTQAATAVEIAQDEYAKQKASGAYAAAVEMTKQDRQAAADLKTRWKEAEDRVQKDLAEEDLLAQKMNQALDEVIAVAQGLKVPVQAGMQEPVAAINKPQDVNRGEQADAAFRRSEREANTANPTPNPVTNRPQYVNRGEYPTSNRTPDVNTNRPQDVNVADSPSHGPQGPHRR